MSNPYSHIMYFWFCNFVTLWCQPPREKTYIRHMNPAKIQISLRIRAVWSESSLGVFGLVNEAVFIRTTNTLIRVRRYAGDLSLYWVCMSEDNWAPTIRLVRPLKTQMSLKTEISLCLRAVWTESLLIACAFYRRRTVQSITKTCLYNFDPP